MPARSTRPFTRQRRVNVQRAQFPNSLVQNVGGYLVDEACILLGQALPLLKRGRQRSGGLIEELGGGFHEQLLPDRPQLIGGRRL